MTGWNEAYPFSAPYQRTAKWYDGDWRELSSWCDQTLPNEWEYFNGEFRFATERAKMLFLLRWE